MKQEELEALRQREIQQFNDHVAKTSADFWHDVAIAISRPGFLDRIPLPAHLTDKKELK